MTGHRQSQQVDEPAADEREKVAAQCRDCGAIYSAWVFADETVQPIGRKDGCRCGTSEFEALSR
ncbi:hypothetical protein C477_19704 [Haloterrigena salina JCM 13891]|uniref:Uncharacterized protein n=1 Tax=Haloterrigena salina JCM 13891 TaxID=1227488 RepID=M0BUP8_9EURY|nr:hypothetical protein [Haloterrigena salina]ELZ14751.1 hypothetical protein C477_19704 [Haloterrigena salina JCM 13891]